MSLVSRMFHRPTASIHRPTAPTGKRRIEAGSGGPR